MRKYVENIISVFSLGKESFVVELASNDGYLLKNFVQREIPCLGIEPTESTTQSEKIGIPVVKKFFSEAVGINIASSYGKADLIIGNNVYAHVPDINDFTNGIKSLLADTGIVTLEFPHLLQLLKHMQFDTIYHEHFSYLSVGVVSKIFNSFGLKVFDVETLETHGGSVRVYGCHSDASFNCTDRLNTLLRTENEFGLETREKYLTFSSKVAEVRENVRIFFARCRSQNKKLLPMGLLRKETQF